MGKIINRKDLMPRTPISFMAQRQSLNELQRRRQTYQNARQLLKAKRITVDERFLESLPPTKEILELEIERIRKRAYFENAQEDVVRVKLGRVHLEFYEMIRKANSGAVKKAQEILRKPAAKRTTADKTVLAGQVKTNPRIKKRAKEIIQLIKEEPDYRTEELREKNINAIKDLVANYNINQLMQSISAIPTMSRTIRDANIFPQRRLDLARIKNFEQLLKKVKNREMSGGDLVELYMEFESTGQIEKEREEFSKAIKLGQEYLRVAKDQRKDRTQKRRYKREMEAQRQFQETLNGTGKIVDEKIEDAIKKVFSFKPADIVKHLDLKRPIFQKTASYGHFGRDDPDFTWEKTDKINDLKREVGF